MGTPFLYSLRVTSGKKGQARNVETIPIYGFKAGMPSSSLWATGEITLDVLKNIAMGADGAKILTVCSEPTYIYRALEDKQIDFLYLSIMDTRIKTAAYETRKIVATITGKDMTCGKRSPVDKSQMKMSVELGSNQLVAVPLDLHNSSDGLTFQRV